MRRSRSFPGSAEVSASLDCAPLELSRIPADTDWTMGRSMRVAVLDVGSNTVRLLVAEQRGGGVDPVREARKLLLLGKEIERTGSLSTAKLDEVRHCARGFAMLAREARASRLEVVITAPGRQTENPAELVAALSEATASSVRVLTAEEEGRMAWEGAVAASRLLAETIAVCDVGGGSTEVLVGTREHGPVWARSLDVGSLRLTERLVDGDPPGGEGVRRMRVAVANAFEGFVVPLPQAALVTGGTARSLRKLVGDRLGEEELLTAARRLTKRTAAEIARSTGVDLERARTLPAGALVLAEVQRRLQAPLVVSRAGLREGLALTLLAEAAAA
jgi:exopolyphosphatase/guanosine-5'-triphosphate,3'-diphosphate pyrophosphatase